MHSVQTKKNGSFPTIFQRCQNLHILPQLLRTEGNINQKLQNAQLESLHTGTEK